MEAIARARYVRTSPRKARLVVDTIRGKHVREALAILRYTPNRAARLVEKVVRSAIANAENNFHMDPDNLRISRAFVDGGPNIMKRLRYAPMGRGYRIIKRMSHITIAVEETEPVQVRKGRAKTAVPATGGKRAPVHTTKPGVPEEVPKVVEEEKPAEVVAEVEKPAQEEVPQAADMQAENNSPETQSEVKGGE
ncbi:MAG: 50S ribosomal protein L22 [Armatimonadota bacterium]